MDQETLAARLQRLIEERQYGRPLSRIAEEAGISLETLQNILDGSTQTPRYHTLQKLADYFELSYEYLLTGQGSPLPAPATMPEIRARIDEAISILQSIADDMDRKRP